MTTTEVAEYLGLAGPRSARNWLRQRGIRAVGRQPGVAGQNLYPTQLVMTPRQRRGGYDRWCDDQGTHLPDGCMVEQVGVHRPHGGARFRLGQRGVVAGRGQGSRVYVRFAGQDTPVSIRPYLVRVLAVETKTPLSTGQIIAELEQLRELLPAAVTGERRDDAGCPVMLPFLLVGVRGGGRRGHRGPFPGSAPPSQGPGG